MLWKHTFKDFFAIMNIILNFFDKINSNDEKKSI